MTPLWKSQNDSHTCLEISHRTRDSHISTSRFRLVKGKKKTKKRRINRPQSGTLSERRTGLLSERRLQNQASSRLCGADQPHAARHQDGRRVAVPAAIPTAHGKAVAVGQPAPKRLWLRPFDCGVETDATLFQTHTAERPLARRSGALPAGQIGSPDSAFTQKVAAALSLFRADKTVRDLTIRLGIPTVTT
jgi:hypothetical protein